MSGAEDSCIKITPSNSLLRARGRRNEAVLHAGFKSSETYGLTAVPTIKSPGPAPASPPDFIPLPQTRANEGLMSTLTKESQPTLSDKKSRFIDRFSKGDWNYPDKVYPEMSTALTSIRALVVAIYYRPSSGNLPATYADACGIVDVLENQFRYPSKCIRVLADIVDRRNKKDKRWPNKENIVEGIQWLTQDSGAGSRRFLFFAGHGYTRRFRVGSNDCTEEGILPRDYLTHVPYSKRFDSNPKEEVDKDTVLLDTELNTYLAGGLADGAKLAVVFDCCHSGGLSELIPEFRDMSTLRSRHLFARQSSTTNENLDLDELYVPYGNMLDLPVTVNLDDSKSISALTRSSNVDNSVDLEEELLEFKAFPKNCEVISWCACDGGQLAHEDGQGGRFTSAFINGLIDPQRPNEINTYRRLNRYILDEFNKHNKAVDEGNTIDIDSEAEVEASVLLPRVSVNKSLASDVEQHQYPKLYVSQCIAERFADQVVNI